MKYAYIDAHQRLWPVRALCKVLEVSFTGYHQHQQRRLRIAQLRYMTDTALLVHIRAIHRELCDSHSPTAPTTTMGLSPQPQRIWGTHSDGKVILQNF